MAPAKATALAVRIQIVRALSGQERETHCVSPARARRCPQDPCHPQQERPAPDPAGKKRPPGAGRALAGGFWPPAGLGSAGRCGRGDGPCHGNGAGGSDSDRPRPLRAGKGNACVSPPARNAATRTRATRTDRGQRPPPAGEKRPPGAGRALAGGFWPPAGQGSAGRCGRGDGPCQRCRVADMPRNTASPGGNRKRIAFPRPCETVPRRSAGPGTTGRQRPTRRAGSARRGRGGRWPGALAPGVPRIGVALWQGRWPRPERAGEVLVFRSGSPRRRDL
jgi:hypothetical protein